MIQAGARRRRGSLHVSNYLASNERFDLLDQGFLGHNAVTVMSGNSGLAASVKVDLKYELAFPGIPKHEVLELHKA